MPRPSPVPDWVPADLPPTPGVYEFVGPGRTSLYVGKSVNLKRRVRGYFYGGGPTSPRLAEMLALSRAVAFRPTGSDLEARLEEAERIVSERPRYNRALKNRARGWFIEINWKDPFPRIRVTRSARNSGARYFGPYRGRKTPDAIRRLLERIFRLRSCSGRVVPNTAGSPCLSLGLDLCSAPCIKATGLSAYRKQVDDAARILADPAYGVSLQRCWARERDQAATALEFERAATIQRRLDWLSELEAQRNALEKPWLAGTWLIVLPHAESGRGVLVPVANGRVLPRRTVDWNRVWIDDVSDTCYAARVAELAAEATLEPSAVATSLIVTNWLLDGGPGGLFLDLSRLAECEIIAQMEARLDYLGGRGLRTVQR